MVAGNKIKFILSRVLIDGTTSVESTLVSFFVSFSILCNLPLTKIKMWWIYVTVVLGCRRGLCFFIGCIYFALNFLLEENSISFPFENVGFIQETQQKYPVVMTGCLILPVPKLHFLSFLDKPFDFSFSTAKDLLTFLFAKLEWEFPTNSCGVINCK